MDIVGWVVICTLIPEGFREFKAEAEAVAFCAMVNGAAASEGGEAGAWVAPIVAVEYITA